MSDSCNTVDRSLPGLPANGVSQARILEWFAISLSRGSFWPRNQTHIYSFQAVSLGQGSPGFIRVCVCVCVFIYIYTHIFLNVYFLIFILAGKYLEEHFQVETDDHWELKFWLDYNFFLFVFLDFSMQSNIYATFRKQMLCIFISVA